MGRRKIEIEKIEDRNRLQVTFTKRRTGVFKKAGELCLRCKSQIAIIVFSPGGKIYSFGHPNAESVIRRYLAEKKRKQMVDIVKRRGGGWDKLLPREWDDANIETATDLPQLQRMLDSMGKLHTSVTNRLKSSLEEEKVGEISICFRVFQDS